MQLNELIEKDGVEKVSLQTTISPDNLNFLIGEKFEKLSRVKTLGFLEILQREYKELEVSELREKAKLYFEENKPDHDNVMVVTEVSSTQGGVSFFKWFVILGIVFGSGYLYKEGKLTGLLQYVSNKKDAYGDEKALENNTTVQEAKTVSVTKNSDKPVHIVAPVEAKIDLEAAIEKEENKTIEVSIPEAIISEEAVAKEIAKAEEGEKIAKVEEIVKVEVAKDEKVKEVATTISTITINPTRGMLWFGFINVDTKKKKEFMKQVSTPFDIKGGRWILVTGHGFVDVVSELNTLEESDSHKHYFYVDSNELKEITQQEFRDFNGGRGWI